MRLDLLLVRLRFAGSRQLAQDWITAGHMRRNGQRVVKANQPVAPGDVLTLPMRHYVRVIEILALPLRRGPPSEAQGCYRVLDAGAPIAIAGNHVPQAMESAADRIEGKSLT
ncbi:S4 domain-containing protein [Alteraurantiacibacter palmitatis]|uniref:S4 domain-containing protein n=1 Tax=Alteraurantiacibacter palmitatis TaxID=2054628 RepID=A0ABV7E1J3_9SPHN